MNVPERIDRGFTRWLTAPEKNAAGRISLYRIVYGLFYLWLTPSLIGRFQRYDLLTAREWDPVFSLEKLNLAAPDPLLIPVLNGILVASLILLIIGFKTRWATLSVLITGVALTAIHYSFKSKIDHSDTFMVAYIPAIMLFGTWGQCYSLDAVIKRRAGKSSVDPHSDAWQHIWSMRLILLLLSFMFIGSATIKISNIQWISDPQLIPNMLLIHNIVAVDSILGPNPLNPVIASIPPIYLALHISALAFESLFPLALINDRWRGFFVATALAFHSFNFFFFTISATPLIGLYLLFVDWQALADRWIPRLNLQIKPWSTPLLIALALGSSAFGVLLWINVNPLRFVIPRTPFQWIIAAPIGLFFSAKYALALLKDGRNYLQRRQQRRTSTSTIHQQNQA